MGQSINIRARIVQLIVVLLFLAIPFKKVFGQEQDYIYTFKVNGITGLGDAKYITDPIRKLFNTAEDRFHTYPTFNDAVNEFHFSCPLLVTQEQLQTVLLTVGHQVETFKREQ